MESFLDLIFSNLFLFIIILSSIFSLFNKNKEEKKKEPNRPKPVPTPPKRTKEVQRPIETYNKPEPVEMKTVEDQQQEQMERLRERFNANVSEHLDVISKSELSKSKANFQASTKKTTNQPIKNQHSGLKLNQKSVLQGIMMSEVLGPPRSRKAYRNIILERKK